MINREVLDKLLEIKKEDDLSLELIADCMSSFEAYHRAIYELEIYKRLFSGLPEIAEEYRSRVSSLDRTRTACHNAVISNVSVLNRMAGKCGLDPVYDGVVSEERPYRRELANAVLAFVRDVINERA